MHDDRIRRNEPLRHDVADPSPVIRVVLAELDSPGPLHYLVEGEGFQVVGCASNDVDLARVLAHTQPDVIVLDADISATSAPVARQKAPSSELIVLWPEGVQLPSGADDRRTRHRRVVELADDDADARTEPPASVDVPSSTAQRTSTRILVGTTALIALIVLTMGASFALEGRNPSPQPTAARSVATSRSATPGPPSSATSTPGGTGGAPASVHIRCASGPQTDPRTASEHAATDAHGAPPTCPGKGQDSAHRSPQQHGNDWGNGHATGAGNAPGSAKGSGNAQARGGGSANAPGGGSANTKGSAGANGTGSDRGAHDPTVGHPPGPPTTPGARRRGPPG